MSNPYLEKAASLYDFWNDFSGKEHNELKARKHHFEKAIANNDTVEGLASRIKQTGDRTFKARGRVGLAALGLAAAGIVGTKKYTEHQDHIATENLRNLFLLQKQAGIASKTISGLKSVGSGTLNVLNTAHGGKVKQFGADSFGKHTPNFKKFVGSSKSDQKKFVKGPELDKLKKLHRQQRVAQVGVYGSAGVLTAAYRSNKNKQNTAYQPQYYY